MPIRASTNSNYQRVLSGLRFNLSRLVLAQEQTATGRRILRPSDDPSGTARVLSFNRQIAESDRHLGAIVIGRAVLDSGAVALQNGSSMLADARQSLLQGMNASLSSDDRQALASEIELIRLALLEASNTRSGDRALFGGTTGGSVAYEDRLIGGLRRTVYLGNDEVQTVRIGNGVDVPITAAGSDVFSRSDPTDTTFSGLTGIASGTTADEGQGYEYLTLRHDATNPGSIATAGLALVNGGAEDTILGAQTLVVDVAAGTVQLGSGPVRSIPQPGDLDLADFVVENAAGGELHLDFSGFTGASFTGSLDATGSISIDGSSFVPIDFTQQDLELIHPQSGNVLHVDMTGVTRAGVELTTFTGRVNAFDVLQGIADDLRNADGLDQAELLGRLNRWLPELDRNHDNLLVALGGLGSRSERLSNTEEKLQGVRVQLDGLRSQDLEADLSETALELARAQQFLELAQASGARLLQTNLLSFL